MVYSSHVGIWPCFFHFIGTLTVSWCQYQALQGCRIALCQRCFGFLWMLTSSEELIRPPIGCSRHWRPCANALNVPVCRLSLQECQKRLSAPRCRTGTFLENFHDPNGKTNQQSLQWDPSISSKQRKKNSPVACMASGLNLGFTDATTLLVCRTDMTMSHDICQDLKNWEEASWIIV